MTPWNPWKLTTIAMMLMMATALVTGLVVANWSGSDPERKPAVDAAAGAARPAGAKAAPARVVTPPAAPAAPPQETIAACNRYAESQLGQRDKTMEVVKDAAIGGVVGAGGGTLYGLNENRQHDERYREAYAGCMRSSGYAG